MKKKPTPTEAQARRLASLFGCGQAISNGGYMNATDAAIMRNGWVTDTGVVGTYPNGTQFTICTINDDGLFALEMFLFKKRK